jgi:hypothetical protein
MHCNVWAMSTPLPARTVRLSVTLPPTTRLFHTTYAKSNTSRWEPHVEGSGLHVSGSDLQMPGIRPNCLLRQGLRITCLPLLAAVSFSKNHFTNGSQPPAAPAEIATPSMAVGYGVEDILRVTRPVHQGAIFL